MILTVDFVPNCCTRHAKKCGRAHFSERPESNKSEPRLSATRQRPAAAGSAFAERSLIARFDGSF